MAFVDTALFYFPSPFPTTSQVPVMTNPSFSMNSAGAQMIVPFTVIKAGTINEIEWLSGGSGHVLDGASVIRISLQDQNSGWYNPDGIQDQYRDVDNTVWTGTDTWLASGLITDDGTDGGVKRTVAVGDRLAIVFEYDTFTTNDSVSLKMYPTDGEESGDQASNWGRFLYFSGSSYLSVLNGYPCIVLKYSDGTYVPVWVYNLPIKTLGSKTLTGSVEAGLKFTPPFAMRVIGAYGSIGTDEDIRVLLYDSGESLLASSGVDTQQTSNDDGLTVYFDTEVELDAGSTYYLVARREGDKTTDGELHYFDVNDAAILDSIAGGQAYHYAERTDYTTNSFGATTTRRPFMGLICNGLDPAAGGGGGSSTVPATQLNRGIN